MSLLRRQDQRWATTRLRRLRLLGRSGAGKSTLAQSLGETSDAALIEGDDFYAGGIELRDDSAEARGACIDWTRQRSVLEALRAGREAVWRAFDREAFDGRLREEATRLKPRRIVILEGVYAAHPELADLVDLRVMLTASDDVRLARLMAREGTIGLGNGSGIRGRKSISEASCRPRPSMRSQSFAHDCRSSRLKGIIDAGSHATAVHFRRSRAGGCLWAGPQTLDQRSGRASPATLRLVEEDNIASQRLCEKLAMMREGLFREFVFFVTDDDGAPRFENTMQYAILRKEWTA